MPESGEGMVQVFRRPESETDTCIFTLHGLAPESDYKLNTFDVAGEAVMSGGGIDGNRFSDSYQGLPGCGSSNVREG